MSRQHRFVSPCGLNGAFPTEYARRDPFVEGSELVEGTYAAGGVTTTSLSCRPDTKRPTIYDSVTRDHEDRGCD
jgi:hypothetical protein